MKITSEIKSRGRLQKLVIHAVIHLLYECYYTAAATARRGLMIIISDNREERGTDRRVIDIQKVRKQKKKQSHCIKKNMKQKNSRNKG